ncbi:MAG: hypothetical protein HYV20_14695 [Gemmatimonadetes bacterium]|nr:hypothetical protein [Gemmatimonadota bacterium]
MLFVLDCTGPGDPEFNRCRAILTREIDHPAKTIVAVRGDGPGVPGFVSNAQMAADRPWRVVLWIKNRIIFREGEEARLFGSDPGTIAVLLDFQDRVASRFGANASVIDVDDAFRAAERQG